MPATARDYVDKLVAPYFTSAVAWYETVGLGVAGGAVYDAVMQHVGDPFFGIGLNPGHVIHLDEWVHSPMKKKGKLKLVSGMALQCDIIPATGTDYFMSNIEDALPWPMKTACGICRTLPRKLVAHHQAPRLHAGCIGHKTEARSSALQQSRGMAAALLAGTPLGHGNERLRWKI